MRGIRVHLLGATLRELLRLRCASLRISAAGSRFPPHPAQNPRGLGTPASLTPAKRLKTNGRAPEHGSSPIGWSEKRANRRVAASSHSLANGGPLGRRSERERGNARCQLLGEVGRRQTAGHRNTVVRWRAVSSQVTCVSAPGPLPEPDSRYMPKTDSQICCNRCNRCQGKEDGAPSA